MRRAVLLSISGVLLLILVQMAWAQVATITSILGRVTDTTDAAVPGAEVVIQNVSTGETRRTTTDASGLYSFPSVAPGTYDITVTLEGFRVARINGRVAEVSNPAQVDVLLEVGDVTESVTVSAAGAELISTTTAEIAGTVSQRLVENLPLNGRNFFDLAATLPHVTPQNLLNGMTFSSRAMNFTFGTGPQSNFFRSSGVIAAGNRDSGTNVSVDGINVQSSQYGQMTPQQPPSSIQEVKVHVSSMNAEFGYGTAAMNVITKSGTNKFHGEAYEFFRNEKLDANGFFNNLAGREKAPYRQNQFGGAFGGPIVFNKLFFFGAYEGLRVRQSTFTINSVPSADLRNGDFSNFQPPGPGGTLLPTPIIYNPYSFDEQTGLRDPFPNNRIPLGASALCAPRPGCTDPATLKWLQDFVLPPNAVIDGIPRLIGDTRTVLDGDQGILRMDWTKSENARIYGRFTRSVTPSGVFGLQIYEGQENNASDLSAVIHWTQILSPSTVNDLFVGYARPRWYLGRRIDTPEAGAILGLTNTGSVPGGPTFGVSGFSMNDGFPGILDVLDDVYQIGDDITVTRSRHNLKFGFQAIEKRFTNPFFGMDKGRFFFQPRYTAACPAGNAACTAARGSSPVGGHQFADFLLGAPSNLDFQLNPSPFHGYKRYYGIYAQDSWRVATRLTLNIGLRWEYWGPWRVPRHTVASFDVQRAELVYALANPLDYLDPATDYGRNAPLNPASPPYAHTQGNKNFGPRIGLAYTLGPGTVLRASYGIYYDGKTNTNQIADIAMAMPPFRLRFDAVASANEQLPSLGVSGNFAFPTNTLPIPNSTPPFGFRALEPHYPLGSVQEWSASLQHRLGSDWAVELSYQGTHAIHLNQFIDLNAPSLPQGDKAGLSLQQRRRFPQWGIIGSWVPIGYGKYHGGAVSVRNTGWRGLHMSSNFTWAKNLVSGLVGFSDQGNQSYEVPYIWEGPANLTPKFRFVNTYSYDLPFGRGRAWGSGVQGFADALISGWSFSGILDLSTGSPNRVQTPDLSGTGYGAMPDRICDGRKVPAGRDRFKWFATECFVAPAFGTWGNSHFGVYDEPGIANWNVSLAKDFDLGVGPENGRLQFRADLFNALNHTQWGNTVANTNSIDYGRILNTRPARQVQFSLRYFF